LNAYELADELDWVCENHLVAIGDADFKATANMLRQQADQIAELEKDLYMIQRHYDQLETFSPSGNNTQSVGNINETLPKGEV
jgi:hypothetical protein